MGFFSRPLDGLLFFLKLLDGLLFFLRPLGGHLFFLRPLDGHLFFLRPLDGLLFKALGWASFQGPWMGFFSRPLDGLLFFSRPLDGLFFKALGCWASLLFKGPWMDFFSRWTSIRAGLLFEIIFANSGGGLFSRWMLQILKLTTVKQWARPLHIFFNHEVCLNVKQYSRNTRTLLFTVLKWSPWASFRAYFKDGRFFSRWASSV